MRPPPADPTPSRASWLSYAHHGRKKIWKKPWTPTCNWNRQNQQISSSAFDMIDNRLGRGWKAPLLRCWCDEGLIKAVNALFTHSPSTPPILTSEFVIADRRIFNRFGVNGAGLAELGVFLCRLHRNEPRWVVGEHMQVLFGAEIGWLWFFFETDIERLGEMDRSIEKRKEGERVDVE
jgi:hypothetical protein